MVFIYLLNLLLLAQAAEITATRSRSEGDGFTGFLGTYPAPLIRPNLYAPNLYATILYAMTGADLPNQILPCGTVRLRWQMQILPIFEHRNGLPFAQYDVVGNDAGVARVLKDIKVNPKYTLRFSVSVNDMTNHFHALTVDAHVAVPFVGTFFGNYPRRFRADFDVVF